MSAVRMCDKCGVIFPEGAEGASIVQGTKNIRNPRTDRVEQHHVQEDWCAKCSGGTVLPEPRLAAITSSEGAKMSMGKAPSGGSPLRSTIVDGGDDEDVPPLGVYETYGGYGVDRPL